MNKSVLNKGMDNQCPGLTVPEEPGKDSELAMMEAEIKRVETFKYNCIKRASETESDASKKAYDAALSYYGKLQKIYDDM